MPTIDQRGALRAGANAGAPDIGAYQNSSSYLVTSAADSDDVGTLRSAVSWANSNVNIKNASPSSIAIPAPNTIVFDTNGVFSKPQTIMLSPALGTLVLSNTKAAEAIVAPGTSIVTLSGGDHVGVFHVLSGVTASLTGLTITHGNATAADAAYGGGIFNEGSMLTVNNCTVSESVAAFGGGIRNFGTMTLTKFHRASQFDLHLRRGRRFKLPRTR